MRVKVKKTYKDTVKNDFIKAGTEFEVVEQRARQLENAGVATIMYDNKLKEQDKKEPKKK